MMNNVNFCGFFGKVILNEGFRINYLNFQFVMEVFLIVNIYVDLFKFKIKFC